MPVTQARKFTSDLSFLRALKKLFDNLATELLPPAERAQYWTRFAAEVGMGTAASSESPAAASFAAETVSPSKNEQHEDRGHPEISISDADNTHKSSVGQPGADVAES
jgi:hypothetical protein